jgi:hypothetical protein
MIIFMGVEESLILRECDKLQLSEYKAHSKTVGCKYAVNEKFMILHSQRLHDLHNLLSVTKRVTAVNLGSSCSWGAED